MGIPSSLLLTSFRISYRLLVAAALLCSQAIVTLWFWISSIADQLAAQPAQSGPTATWLGGTVLFLGITAGFQWTAIRNKQAKPQKNWQDIEPLVLFGIMAASLIGGMITFGIYLVRRPGWTYGDTICLAAVLILQALALGFQFYQTRHANGTEQPRWYKNMHTFLLAPFGRMALAISLRSVPRIFYGFGFFTAPFLGMSRYTILSGIGIATVRTTSVLWGYHSNPCPASARLLKTEIIGNLGSQIVLSLCWVIAVIYMR